MNGDTDPKLQPRATAWGLAASCALLVYALSVPWVDVLSFEHGFDENVLVQWYEAPWNWIGERSLLHAPMMKYEQWCHEQTGVYPAVLRALNDPNGDYR